MIWVRQLAPFIPFALYVSTALGWLGIGSHASENVNTLAALLAEPVQLLMSTEGLRSGAISVVFAAALLLRSPVRRSPIRAISFGLLVAVSAWLGTLCGWMLFGAWYLSPGPGIELPTSGVWGLLSVFLGSLGLTIFSTVREIQATISSSERKPE
jgi:hypothetical protein